MSNPRRILPALPTMFCVRWYPATALVYCNRHPARGWFRSHRLRRILPRSGNHPIGSRGGGIPLQVRAALLSPRGWDYLGCRIPSLPAGPLRYCLAISGNGRPRVCVDSGDWMHVRLGIAYAMPVAAVTTIELALGLVLFCVTAAVMVGGRAPLLIGGAAPLLVE